jgi:hypothetical protein
MALEERSTRLAPLEVATPEDSALAMDEMGVVMVAEVLGVVGRMG